MSGDFSLRLRDRTIATSRQVEVGLLAGIILVAAALRFYKLGDWSFWIDEIYTLGRAQAHYSTLESTLRNIPPNTNWVPVSVLLTSAAVKALGISTWSARLASVFIGLVTIPTLYWLVKRLVNEQVAVVSALLLAISPWHLTWSQNARFYTAILLFSFLAITAIYIGLEQNRRGFLLAGLVFFYLAASERIFALFLVPVIACYLLSLWLLPFERPTGFTRSNLVILSIPLIGGLVVEGVSLLTSGTSRFFADFGWFLQYRNYRPIRLLVEIIFSLGPVLVVTALLGSYYLVRQRSRIGLLFTVVAVIPMALLLPLSLIMFTQDRYVFFTLPAWVVLAAVTVRQVWIRLRGEYVLIAGALLLALLADAVETNALYFRSYGGNRLDWQAAFTLVRDSASEEDAVVAFWPEFGDIYLGREVLAWEDVTPDSIVALHRRVWFVVDSETVHGDLRKKAWIEANAELVEVFYLRTPADRYLRVYRYDPARNATEESS